MSKEREGLEGKCPTLLWLQEKGPTAKKMFAILKKKASSTLAFVKRGCPFLEESLLDLPRHPRGRRGIPTAEKTFREEKEKESRFRWLGEKRGGKKVAKGKPPM